MKQERFLFEISQIRDERVARRALIREIGGCHLQKGSYSVNNLLLEGRAEITAWVRQGLGDVGQVAECFESCNH